MEPLLPFHSEKQCGLNVQHSLKRIKVADSQEDYTNNKEDTSCVISKRVQELSSKNADLEEELCKIKLEKSTLEDKLLASSCYFNKQLKEAYSQRNHYQVLCQKLEAFKGEDESYDDDEIDNEDSNKLANGHKTMKAKYFVLKKELE